MQFSLKETPTLVFSCEFPEYLRAPFLQFLRAPPVAASDK